MADIKVSALAAGTAITDADLFYYVDGATSKKITALILSDYIKDSINIKINSAVEPSYFWGGGNADLDGCVGSVGIGFAALYSGTSANANVAVGTYAGWLLTTGDNNTLIGSLAGGLLTTASGCVCIGYKAGSLNTTANLLFIDNSDTATPLIGGDFSTNRVGINLAVASLAFTLDVGGIVNSTGGFYVDATARIDGDGFFKPAISSDASAPTNSIYYSTTANRLVYKDSGGSVNNLY